MCPQNAKKSLYSRPSSKKNDGKSPDEWMDGRTDYWRTDGWMDGQKDRWPSACVILLRRHVSGNTRKAKYALSFATCVCVCSVSRETFEQSRSRPQCFQEIKGKRKKIRPYLSTGVNVSPLALCWSWYSVMKHKVFCLLSMFPSPTSYMLWSFGFFSSSVQCSPLKYAPV